jgi:excisionase family DNA binding protein
MLESNRSEFFTSKEVAEMLRVTPATVMNMIHRGIFQAKKVGIAGKSSPWRIYKEDVIKYIEREEEKSSVKAST